MAESGSLRKIQKLVFDSDMAAAAQQLLQLSEEGNHSRSHSHSSCNVKKISSDGHQGETVQRIRNEITWEKKLEENFGKEEEVSRPKKRKYRTLVSIYQKTNPILPWISEEGGLNMLKRIDSVLNFIFSN